MNTMDALGKRIKELRKAKNLKQEELAERIGVEPATISNIECGRNYPTIRNLENILYILDSNFLEVFNFEHIDKREILVDKLKTFLDNANLDEIKFLYKIIQNLKEYNKK